MPVKKTETKEIPTLFNQKADIALPDEIEIKDGSLTSEKEMLTLALLVNI